MTNDPFSVLGVARDATDQEIKAAYRSKAKTMHPDRGGDPEEFALLSRAFEILSDPVKRELFERTGQWFGATNPPKHPDHDLFEDLSSIVCTAFVVRNPELDDIIAVSRKFIREANAKLDQEIKVRAAAVEKVGRHAARLKAKKGDNILAAIVGARMSAVRREIEGFEAVRVRHERMLKFLDGYSYEHDEHPVAKMMAAALKAASLTR